VIKHYKEFAGNITTPCRGGLLFNLAYLSMICVKEKDAQVETWDYKYVSLTVDGAVIPYALSNEELDELIEDMKGVKDINRRSPNTVARHHWSEGFNCYVDINGEPVL
jgi:hypothetical protein